MKMRGFRPATHAVLRFLVACLASAGRVAQAQADDPNTLFDHGAVVEACAAAKRLSDSESLDVWFALGRCAALSGDYEAAIEWFRKILAIADAGRTRLELARSLNMAGRPKEAREAYEAVLGSAPPQTIREWVMQEMAELQPAEKLRYWRWQFGLSPVWDSNVNVGPVNRSIMLFDLPFELNDASVAHSDTGLSSWLGVEMLQATPLGTVVWAIREQTTTYRTSHFANLRNSTASASLVRSGELAQWTWAIALDRQSQRSGSRVSDLVGSAQVFVPLGVRAEVSWAASIQMDIGRISSQAAQTPDAIFSTLRAASPVLRARLPDGLEALMGIRWAEELSNDSARQHHDRGWQFSTQGRLDMVCATCVWSVTQTSLASRYTDIDPLFEATRSDGLETRSLKIFGSPPHKQGSAPVYTLLVENSRNRSNLSLYQYRRTRLVLSTEWNF
jgi:tetratricopeptide (TPR) repeat protein